MRKGFFGAALIGLAVLVAASFLRQASGATTITTFVSGATTTGRSTASILAAVTPSLTGSETWFFNFKRTGNGAARLDISFDNGSTWSPYYVFAGDGDTLKVPLVRRVPVLRLRHLCDGVGHRQRLRLPERPDDPVRPDAHRDGDADGLMAAFRATLEELEDADLLLHIVDASSPRFEQHIASVEKVLSDLNLLDKKRLLVFNKTDRLSAEEAGILAERFQAVPVSARNNKTFGPLLAAMERDLFDGKLAEARV